MGGTLLANPEQGFWLNFQPGRSEPVHEFCGPNEIKSARCPNCSKPLLRILSLSAADSRLNLDPSKTPVVHLLYCWTCGIPYGVFSYRLLPDGSIQLLQVPESDASAFGPGGPYDGYTGDFPGKKVGLIPLTEDAQQRQRVAQLDTDVALELSGEQEHQIGGSPVISNSQEVECSVCGQKSPLLAVISDNASGVSISLPVPALESFTDKTAESRWFFTSVVTVLLSRRITPAIKTHDGGTPPRGWSGSGISGEWLQPPP